MKNPIAIVIILVILAIIGYLIFNTIKNKNKRALLPTVQGGGVQGGGGTTGTQPVGVSTAPLKLSPEAMLKMQAACGSSSTRYWFEDMYKVKCNDYGF